MKRWLLLLLMIGVGWCAAAQTSLYNKYASNTNIKVACVNNFVLDTGVETDVTILAALDDEGWKWMCNEFAIGELSHEQQQEVAEGQDVFMFIQRDKENLRQSVTVTGEAIEAGKCCYVGVSYLDRSIFVFSCNSEREQNAIVAYMVERVLRRQGVEPNAAVKK